MEQNCIFVDREKDMFEIAVTETKKYIEGNKNIRTLVLGFSGGADSTLTAAIAKEAIKRSNRSGSVYLIGACLPSKSNKENEILRAEAAAAAFCHKVYVENIDEATAQMSKFLMIDRVVEDTEKKVLLGNLKARIRMIYLYNLARSTRGIVLSTDNYTEYLLGFWTLHGDVGDLSPIQYLWKTEVYQMLGYLFKTEADPLRRMILRDVINAVPTDGLGITNSDIDQLLPNYKGSNWIAAYKIVDNILINILNGERPNVYEGHYQHVKAKYEKTMFKRTNPVTFPRRYFYSKLSGKKI